MAASGSLNGAVLPSTQKQAWLAVQASSQQHTLAQSVQQAGVGLHTGKQVTVTLCPAPDGTGRQFLRTDMSATGSVIPATIQSLHQTVLSTELAVQNVTVRTVEHLLAALNGLGIDNVTIQIDGPEVPLLDGSALPWVQAIAQAGWQPQSAQRYQPVLEIPIVIHQGDAFVAAVPAPATTFTYGIQFPQPAIGQQWQTATWPEFIDAIAPARTFGFAAEVEKLRAAGLIKGGSLENALVCGASGWLNPPLRFPNEPVRHKLLDLVGDLGLLGFMPKAHFLAYKASHALHTQLVQKLAQYF